MKKHIQERHDSTMEDGPDTKNLLVEIRGLILSARAAAARSVNLIQVHTNFEIGRRIVEHEQSGAERAEYGQAVLKELSVSLNEEFGKGFSKSNLEYMRRFFLLYRSRQSQIAQTVSGQLQADGITQTLSGQLAAEQATGNGLDHFATTGGSAASSLPFALSWSHYIFLMSIDNPDERAFYEIEAVSSGWSLRELKRQFDSSLYERLALSRDKEGVRKLAKEGQRVSQPQDMLKEPYVLEFLGLDEKERYSECDLETAIIDKLEHFLLELGKGFLFEARQRRFTFDGEHFFVDLVFYNRLLRCFVLIDLILGQITHQDLGQMQMYVNYFDRHVKRDEENPTVGIVLCKKNRDALVEITLPKDANIHAKEYRLYLPDKEELKRKLMEWTEEGDEGQAD